MLVYLEVTMILQQSVRQAQLPKHCCMLYRQGVFRELEKLSLLANCQIAPSAQVRAPWQHPVALNQPFHAFPNLSSTQLASQVLLVACWQFGVLQHITSPGIWQI